MPKGCHRLAPLLLVVAIVGCGGASEATSTEAGTRASGGPDAFDEERAFADLERQVELGPRPAGSEANVRNAAWIAGELRDAGLEDVRIQRPERNVVGTIPGSGPGWVVIGAHHDTPEIPGVVGANDGASGVAVVLELARTLPNPMPGPGLSVALFDAEEARGERSFEEDGTRGSRQFVTYAREGRQGTPALADIEAMVLFDMVGDCDLSIPLEANSDPRLHDLFADADAALFDGESDPVLDDHIPFIEAGIPSVDLIDFEFGPGGSPGEFWHTTEDDLDRVCPESLGAVGSAALEAIPRIGAG